MSVGIETKMRIFELAAAHCDSRGIAARLNMRPEDFAALAADDPEIPAILESGQSWGESELKIQLFRKAQEGNIAAIRAFLDFITKRFELQLVAEGRAPRVPVLNGVIVREVIPALPAPDLDERAARAAQLGMESLDGIEGEEPEDLPSPRLAEKQEQMERARIHNRRAWREARKAGRAGPA
jgi:hypothetical protein